MDKHTRSWSIAPASWLSCLRYQCPVPATLFHSLQNFKFDHYIQFAAQLNSKGKVPEYVAYFDMQLNRSGFKAPSP
jgi:hypothetical protein